MKDIVRSIANPLLAALAAFLVGKGWLTSDQTAELVPAIVTLAVAIATAFWDTRDEVAYVASQEGGK